VPSCTTFSPYCFATFSTLMTSSPPRAAFLKSNVFSMMRRGGSIFSIFSSFFTRLCTCAAWLARALKRSMNACSFASIACWRSYCASACFAAMARCAS